MFDTFEALGVEFDEWFSLCQHWTLRLTNFHSLEALDLEVD